MNGKLALINYLLFKLYTFNGHHQNMYVV